MKKRIFIALLLGFSMCIYQVANAQLGKLVSKAKSITNNASSESGAEGAAKSESQSDPSKSANVVKNAEIIFSSVKMNAGTDGTKTSFQEGENIFARIALDKPVKSFINTDMDAIYLMLNYKIDDEDEGYMITLEPSNFDKNSNILDFDVVASSSFATTYYRDLSLPSFIKKAMENVSPNGKVEFKIKLDSYAGSFTLQKKSDASFTQWIDPICEHSKQMMDEKNVQKNEANMKKEDKLPEEFHKPSGKFDDPELSIANIRKYLSEKFHVDKIVIGPGFDYDVRKDTDGLISSKVTHRYILFSYKDDKTGKCYYNACLFYREYEGGGKYGNLRYSYDDYPVLLTNCNEVNP